MVKRFSQAEERGSTLPSRERGEVGAGDEIKVNARDPNAVPVPEITRLYVAKKCGDERPQFVAASLASCDVAGELERVFPGAAREDGCLG
jgi:MOSC domain-containing protein YiiM